MTNYDAGEDFAAGDDLDDMDWRGLSRVRDLIARIPDPSERRATVVELLKALYGPSLDLR